MAEKSGNNAIFRYEKDADNVVTLTLDMVGRGANVINKEFSLGFANVLARLADEETLAGVIITSGKKLFLAGADLESLLAEFAPDVLFADAEKYKRGLRMLETLGKPVVAALNGTALGGGLELALACHYRVAINNPKSKFGFPEVTLGLLPGGGGITRMVRMLGLQEAFPYLTEGTQLGPQQALDLGIVDALAEDVDDMMMQARAWIAANPAPKKPWDQARFRIPGGNPSTPRIAQMLAIAPAMMRKKTRGNYPAPEAILAAAVEGAQVDFETAGRIESRYFAKIASGQVSKNMITALWFNLNAINKGGSRPQKIPPQETQKVGVLGAGLMGHGIAYASAYAGLEVVLKDLTLEAAQTGKARIEALLQGQVKRGRLTAEKMQTIADGITCTGSAADLQGCDLIIEAVFEDRELKARVTAEAEAQMLPEGVFASNTSTLPITGLAKAAARPEQFIGLHFFSPVHKMKLVEIIVGEQTSDATLAKAFDYVRKIRKVPIVVNDSRGFYTSRVFITYVYEGMALLAEGQVPQAIEAAGMQAGMPVGPLAVSDEVSLGLMAHIREQTRKDLAAGGNSGEGTEGQQPPDHPANRVLDLMLDRGRMGRAQGGGFYEYPTGQAKRLWPELITLFSKEGAEKLDQQEMIDRLLFMQALESVRCLEEGVLHSVADANIGSIFGWGFAPFHGGTLQFINGYGLPAFVERSRRLARAYGDRFDPPPLLLEKAAYGGRFE